MRGKTKRLTLSAAIVALTVVLLWLGSLVEILDLVTVFVASLFIAFSVCEFGIGWSFLPWIASGVLSLLLLPGRFVVWEYALLVGVLPILKAAWEKLRARWLAFLGKFASFEILFVALLCIGNFVLGGIFEEVTFFSLHIPAWAVPLILLILGNICFLLYDYLLTRMVVLYYTRLRPRIARFLN